MSSIQTWRDQRESRYELSRTEAEQVLAELSKRLPVVTFNGGPATTLIATLYYDTAEKYFLKRALLGKGVSAIKVRAREYFPISDDEQRLILGRSPECFLERKERTGTIRNKDRVRISKRELGPIIEGTKRLPDTCPVLQTEIANHQLRPVLLSMYERRVWGDEVLRITLDERIRYYRPPAGCETGWEFSLDDAEPPTALGPKRILEVKHSAQADLPSWLVSLQNGLVEAEGFSKFINGMQGIGASRRSKLSLTRPVYSLP